jgi:hypothetical protein
MGEAAIPQPRSWPVIPAAAALAVALAVPVWLWVCYGATLFFETIQVGFVACFG